MGIVNRFLLGTLILMGSALANSAYADWTLPADAINNTGDFGNCTFNSGTATVTCTNNVNLNLNNATLTITQNLTLVVNPGLNTPEGIVINPNNDFALTIDVGSSNFNMNGNGAEINANIIGENVNVSGTASVVNGNITASNQVNVNSDAAVYGNVSGTNLVSNNGFIEGDVTTNGQFTNNSDASVNGNVFAATSVSNNGIIIGDASTNGNFVNNSNAIVDGNVSAGGSVSNNGTVSNNIEAGGSVTNNSGAIAGSINADGPVTNDGTVLSYINSPSISGNGTVEVTCDINTNDGPCPGAPDSCELVFELSEFGIIGDTNFTYGGNSTINGNEIDGEGNTPTPEGSVTTVPTEFPPIDPAVFPFNQTGGPNRDDQTNIPSGSYGTVQASGNNAFSSFTGGGTYYIERLDIDGNDATIQFAPGDYFIEMIDMDNRSYITVVPDGLVRIFVGTSIEGRNNIYLNSGGNPGNLIIYLYENVTVSIGNFNQGSGQLNFSGSIYSPYDNTQIEFGNNNNIEGSIISAGEVSVGSGTNFTYSVQTQEAIISSYGCTPVEAEIDHYRIRHPVGIVSCFTAAVSVDACADETCSSLYEDPVELTLNSTAAASNWLGGDVVSTSGTTGTLDLTNGTGIIGLQNVPGGTATLSVSNTNVAALNATQCFDSAGTSATSCNIDFRTAGLLFVGQNNFDPVPNSFAGQDFPVALRAVETNINTGACEARVEGAQTVNIGVECLDPNQCQTGQSYTVNGTSIGLNNAGASTNKQPVSLTFNANGIAVLPHNYTDVGELRLHAELNLPAEPSSGNPNINDPATTLEGSSINDFVVKPHTLILRALDSEGDIWTATTDSGAGFQAAGSPFDVIIQALNANGNPTPNFGNESTPVGVQAAFDSLAFPAGGENGTVGFTDPFAPDAVYSGAQRSEGVVWSEAGTVNLRANLTSNNYLGAGDVFAKPPSPVGRFYPDYFTLVDSSVADACTLGSFSYMGHSDILINYTLNAVNVNGSLTENYGFGDYVGSAVIAPVAANTSPADVPGDSFATRLDAISAPAWSSGVLEYQDAEVTFQRRADNQADGPYESLQIGLQVTSELDNRGFDNTTLVTQSGNANPLAGTLNLRYGRLALENISGPEDEDLAVSMQAEYWNGSLFVINDLDSCTPTSAVNLSIIDNPESLTTSPDGIASILESGDLIFGDLFWEAANASGEFEFEYQAPVWLQFPWDGISGNTYQNPRAFGSFGQYRGNDRVIYWLELR